MNSLLRKNIDNFKQNRWLEIFYITVLFSVIINLIQSKNLDEYFVYYYKYKIILFYAVHLGLLLLSGFLAFPSFVLPNGLIRILINKFRYLNIPKGAKAVIAIVLIGNIISISVGRPLFPFYDVGMFRRNTHFKSRSKIVYRPKYFYYVNGEPKILDLRKEGFFFLSEHWGLHYTHEFTFGATFHNKGQKENFEFILSRVKPLGIDTLWVGIHMVNYESREVWFDPDICHAIEINQTQKLHYGPIYIPEYQINKCNEN